MVVGPGKQRQGQEPRGKKIRKEDNSSLRRSRMKVYIKAIAMPYQGSPSDRARSVLFTVYTLNIQSRLPSSGPGRHLGSHTSAKTVSQKRPSSQGFESSVLGPSPHQLYTTSSIMQCERAPLEMGCPQGRKGLLVASLGPPEA